MSSLAALVRSTATLAGLAALSFVTSAAHAQFTQYTTLSSFNAAAGSNTTVTTFNNTPTQILASPATGAFATTIDGITFTGNSNGDYIAIAAGTNPGNIDGTNFLYFSQRDPLTGQYTGDGGVGPSFTITFGGPVTSFAFDWVDTDLTDAYAISINGSTFTTPPFSTAGTGSGFFGVVADAGTTLQTITFTQNAAGGVVDPFGIDNIRVNSNAITAVPEPGEWATMGMAATGLCGLMVRARRRKQNTGAMSAA